MEDMQRSFNTDLLDDSVFRKQSLAAQMLYVRLYMHRKNHFTGLFQIASEHLAVDMRLGIGEVEEALAELERNDFVMVDRDRELVWVPEMRRVLVGAKLSETQSKGISAYLFALRPCVLVKRVCDSLGISYPHQVEKSQIGVPIPLSIHPSIDPSLSNSISRSNSNTPDKQTAGPETTPVRVADSVPINFLGALAALVEGLGGGSAWQALQAQEHASTTGLPPNIENSWSAVWRALCEAKQPPTAEDVRKLGRWWARGGAAKCKKLRFTYLGNVERFTEWLALSMAWDGESDPTPRDESSPLAAVRAGPDVPEGLPDSAALRTIREQSRRQREEMRDAG